MEGYGDYFIIQQKIMGWNIIFPLWLVVYVMWYTMSPSLVRNKILYFFIIKKKGVII